MGTLGTQHGWLVRLRWVAVGGVLGVSAVGAALDWYADPGPLFVVAAAMAGANLFFGHARLFRGEDGASIEVRLAMQQVFDLCMLTLLLHWTGGIENPFAMFFVFHMAIGAVLFPRRQALLFGALAVVLFGSTVVAEAADLLPHRPLLFLAEQGAGLPWHTPLFVAGYLVAFTLTMFGVIGFVRAVEVRRQRAERAVYQRERVALSRERLARIGELSANVAHTVRNPLHGALNCVDLLRSGPAGGDEDSRETLDLLQEGLNRIESVTSRLLRFTGNHRAEPQPTDLNELIEGSLAFVDRRQAQQSVHLHTHLANGLPRLPLDQEQVSEALINLLDNAVFACRDGGTVTVSTESVEGSEPRVSLEVTDTGEGITADDLTHVFDPFFTTKSVGKGSGLGLAIARRVVEEHDGTIEIQSTPGEGTRIRILLPVAGPQAAA